MGDVGLSGAVRPKLGRPDQALVVARLPRQLWLCTYHHTMTDPHHASHPVGGLLSSEPVPDPSVADTGTSTPTFTNRTSPAYGKAPPRPPQTSSQARTFDADPHPWPTRKWAYQWRPLRGMWADVRRRAPFYLSDWTEAARPRNWERTVAATVRIYFLK